MCISAATPEYTSSLVAMKQQQQYRSSTTLERTDITSPKLIEYKHNYQFYEKQARKWQWPMVKQVKQNLSHISHFTCCPLQLSRPRHSLNSPIH